MTTENQTHEFKVDSPAKLLVKNIRGNVEVIPGADGIIKVEVITYPDDGNAEDTNIELTQDADGRVRAEVRMPEKWFGIGYRKPLRVDFKIEAPVETEIKAKLVSGSVQAAGFRGRQDLTTVSGSVIVEDLEGWLDLDSVSGKITGKNLRGEAKVTVVSGRMHLTGCDFSSLEASSVSGKVEVETKFGEGPYRLKAVSGSLLMVVPEGSGCEVDASAVSGRFATDLPVNNSTIGKRHWHVRIGDGGPLVRMKTVSGRMRLLSSFDAKGHVPGVVRQSREDRKAILSRLSEGDINVDEAMKELAP